MIEADKRHAVFLLHQEGMSPSEMARRLHISRNTVRSIIAQKGEIPVRVRKDKIRVDAELLQRLYQEAGRSGFTRSWSKNMLSGLATPP